jgi:hypothetical protein
MGMSTYVTGFVSPNNETYKKHCKVLRACIDAGIYELPSETADYFGSKYPSEDLFEEKLEVSLPIHEWNDGDMCEGFEISVSEIPEGVEIIRFVNSY